jgi:hypothetical protein
VGGRHGLGECPDDLVAAGRRLAPAADEVVQGVPVEVSVPGCRSA